MIDKLSGFWNNDYTAGFFKIFLPALVGVAIKVAVMMQREKLSALRVILSFVIGCGCAWLASGIVKNVVSTEWFPVVIAVVAISGDKVAEFIIYKWNVDALILNFLEWVVGQIKTKK